MPIRVGIWKVGPSPAMLSAARLENEEFLEDMIVAAPSILSDEWMLIGRQVHTDQGGIIDLLAIALDGSLKLIELKRNRTPREVVAQALDYAGWVEQLGADAIAAIYNRFAPNHSLAQDFKEKFAIQLDEEALNQSHQIIIVAAEIDDSTERIVSYLSNHDVPINVLVFQVFANGSEKFLSRAWLLDPVRVAPGPDGATERARGEWNHEFYCNFGHGENRSWPEAVNYGFICAGGGPIYSRPLLSLQSGDRIWVKAPDYGFVGVGRVTGLAQPASLFMLRTASGDLPALQVLKDAKYHSEFVNDPERCEYFVPVKWLQTVQLEHAVHEIGLFGSPLIVCKPTTPKWQHTIERLKEKFPDYSK